MPALAMALAAVTDVTAAPGGASGNCAPIMLDIGHTPKGPGATSARGVGEYTFNRRFALELKQTLTRETSYPVELAYGGREDLGVHRRAQFIKAMTSGVFLSIHHDSAQPRYLESWNHNGRPQRHTDRFSGFSLFVSGQAQSFAGSIVLAKAIGERFIAAGASPTLHHSEPLPGENRPLIDAGLGLYRFDELAVLRYAKVPAVLIELGVILNRRDEEKLNDIAYRRRLQGAIVAALRRFCEMHSAGRG